VYLALLAVAFAAMLAVALPMAFGRSPSGLLRGSEPASALAPPALLALLVLGLGLHIPLPLRNLLEQAARLIGGH
jgi:hydrogenase-4 component F